MTKTISFPDYYLQSDWQDSTINEKIWLHSKYLNQNNDDYVNKTYNLKIIDKSNIIIDGNNSDNDDDIKIEHYSQKCMAIQDKKSSITHRFIPPVRIFKSLHNQKSITALDVAPTGIAVSASTDGTIKIWDTIKNVQKLQLNDHHYLDVNCCKFFPSNEVCVSAGMDMLIKIWSAIDGSCPVTLKGHTGSINDLAIVDRGRNIISVGRDGKAKLWSCGKQLCIENLYDIGDNNNAINACAIKSVPDSTIIDLGQRQDSLNDDCIGTGDKILLLATESGTIYGIGVNSKQLLFKNQNNNNSSINCITIDDKFNYYYGQQDGCCYQYDLRNNQKPLMKLLLSKSPILSIISVKRPFNGIVYGCQNGTVNFFYENQQEIVHLTGSDCDYINNIVYDNKFIYTSCRDGIVRKYYLNNAFE